MSTSKSHGGKRAGAGRKPRLAFIDESLLMSGSPLQYLLDVMRDETAPPRRRDEAAKAALPYCHRRLAAKEVGLKEERQQQAESAGIDTEWGDDLSVPSKAN
jgi:hypothetical protein